MPFPIKIEGDAQRAWGVEVANTLYSIISYVCSMIQTTDIVYQIRNGEEKYEEKSKKTNSVVITY